MKNELYDILLKSDAQDISILADIITDNGKGRLSLDSDVCNTLYSIPRNNVNGLKSDEILQLITKEIQLFGGNTIANIFRGGKGVEYHEIVRDVANHLKVSSNSKTTSEELEIQILLTVVEKAMDKMSSEEQREIIENISGGSISLVGPGSMAALQALIRAGGFASYQLALLVANIMARQLTGKGLALATNASLTKAVSIFAGPIGWVLTAIWTAYDLASPAYRVTVPSVVIIAYLRQKLLFENAKKCPKCNTPIIGTPKFCGECGNPLT